MHITLNICLLFGIAWRATKLCSIANFGFVKLCFDKCKCNYNIFHYQGFLTKPFVSSIIMLEFFPGN